MKFEYDLNKNKINKEKHGIDFIKAKKLFNDENGKVFKLKYGLESGYMRIAKINNELYIAIYTLRKNKIRLISVRRANKKELIYYE
jgi:uncharacterized DUF497 family protein